MAKRLLATEALIGIMQYDKPLLAKVLVAGASGVGKTSLVSSLVFDGFTDVTPTIGVNFAQKVVKTELGPVNLSIWDLSGQPRFQCLMSRFCQGATGLILVFDLTNPSSLDSAGQWLTRIASYNPPSHYFPVVLVGNKLDLIPEIPLEVVQEFCALHQLTDYVPCSAKKGENIRQVFNALCSKIQQSHSKLTQTTPSVT